MGPGVFIEPNPELAGVENLAEQLGIPITSGYQARSERNLFEGRSRFYDAIIQAQSKVSFPYEDQCSGRYYFDLVRTLRDFYGEFERVVEVGVFMGGSTSVLAGCMNAFAFDLDLVDISAANLQFAYERVRRTYPENAGRIRMFHGDLPSYVRAAMLETSGKRSIVHHDGSHVFDDVVRDLASLFYVQEDVHAVIVQDTHLRSPAQAMTFVDMAVYAVFGVDVKCAPIGTTYAPDDTRTCPNPWEGHYFLPDTPEGMVIPLAVNSFRYPHPTLKMEDIIPPARAT